MNLVGIVQELGLVSFSVETGFALRMQSLGCDELGFCRPLASAQGLLMVTINI